MSDEEVHDVVEGEGYAVANIAALGGGGGFRRIRQALGVREVGINAVVIPSGYGGRRHYHDVQEETYFVHRGTAQLEFDDGSVHRLGPGGIARVDPKTVRRMVNVGEDDLVYVAVGAKGGFVDGDGRLVGEPD